MRSRERAPDVSAWRAIASLGEELIGANSLVAQHDRIVSMIGRVVRGKVEVWLHESLFRLPDWNEPRAFPNQPTGKLLRSAFLSRKTALRQRSNKNGTIHAIVAIPVVDQGLLLGVLQVSRSKGPRFDKDELEILHSIAGVVAVGLYAWHRVEVERFRLGELNLVGRVSAEIANVLQLDELSRRVCELIQSTFNYYYVAIFTLKPGDSRLRFRSSASTRRTGTAKAPLALEVEIGQGLIGEAAASGALIVVPDVRSDPRYRYLEPLPRTRAETAIPLKLGDRVLGVLDVQADRAEAFHPNDLMILQALADNVARAVEGTRLYGDVRRRAEQLTLLADVSRSVASTLDLDEMMGEAASLIRRRFGFPHVTLFTVHPNRMLIEYEAGSGKRSKALQGYTIPLDAEGGIIPWAARQGRTVLANDVSLDSRYRPSPWPPKNTRSELTVPLVFGDRVLGILDIQSDRPNAFSEDDVVMFEAVAGAMAASIRNADLYRSEQWRRQVADSLREVAGLLSEHVGADEALDAILRELERNLPVDVSVIWLRDGGRLYAAAVHGKRAQPVQRGATAEPSDSAILEALMRSAEPTIRIPTDPMWPSGAAASFPTDYSSLAAPLRLGSQPVGIITLAHHERGRYGHEARAMTTTFASYAAVAIENARMYDAAQEQAYVSAALLQVAQAAANPGTIDETLQSIVRLMPTVLGAPRAAIYCWDVGRRSYIPRAEVGLTRAEPNAVWGSEIKIGHFRLLDAARTSGTISVHGLRPQNSLETWPKLKGGPLSQHAMAGESRLLIAVPLLTKTDLLGVLLVEEGNEARRQRRRRFQIINGAAQQIAMALQDDLLQREMVARERLETEAELARQIQRTFLPDVLPSRSGWELAVRWETARQVGGDFYDVVELPEGKLGLFVADVADKGMPAALFMALTRTLFRATVAEGASPAQALARMNHLLLPDTRTGMFVTAVYGVLDPDTGDFTYANAGHNPPLWIRPGPLVEQLTRTSMALGVMDSAAVDQRTIRLQSGEGLLLYTDGLTEAFSPDGELFGEGRLLRSLRKLSASSAENTLESVQSSLRAFIGQLPLSDDLTMLLLRRT